MERKSKFIIYKIVNKVLLLPLFYRRLILIFCDAICIPISIFICELIIKDFDINNFSENLLAIMFFSIFFALPYYILTGHYRTLARYAGSTLIYKFSFRALLISCTMFFIGNSTNLFTTKASFWFLFFFLLLITTFSLRILMRDIFRSFRKNKKNIKNVAIYGAGKTGIQISSQLIFDKNYKVKTIIDKKIDLVGRAVNGIPINSSDSIKKIVDEMGIEVILFAIPTLSKSETRKIVNELSDFNLKFLKIPPLKDISKGDINIDSIKPIAIEDLLGRDKVEPDENMLSNSTKEKIICVTGAGGSIGSELCRQIVNLNPKKLILLENNELNLYQIVNELDPHKNKITPVLGNACDFNLVNKVFEKFQVDIVFHVAAYKHVPIVEINPLEGIKNNVISTKVICEAAKKQKVKQVMFISTDKAVRPTNIMGASKRVAEIVIKSYANSIFEDKKDTKTKFSIVRFGNVLGSSGSVVPLFKQQIQNGGPITITDKNVIRYFMTIKEAVELVLQSSTLSKGNELFILDMGKPVKIIDLAKQMISNSGLKIKNERNPDGDIEIVITGLRPGEKLFEELLLDSKSVKTNHPLIYKSIEKEVDYLKFKKQLQDLENNLAVSNEEKVLKILSVIVPEWKRYKSN